MTVLEILDIALAHRASRTQSRNASNEQTTAESDTIMNLAGRHGEAVLCQGLLPCDRMRIHGIDEGAVEVEDECFHTALDVALASVNSLRSAGRLTAPRKSSPIISGPFRSAAQREPHQ